MGFIGNDDGLLSFSREPRVLELIKQNTVPLQVTEGSQDYGFFSQVFPVKAVPSIYVIKQSQVLDVFTEDLPLEEFIERFERSLGLGGNQHTHEAGQLSAATDNESVRRTDEQASSNQSNEPSSVNEQASSAKPDESENKAGSNQSNARSTTNRASTADSLNKATSVSNTESRGTHSSTPVSSKQAKGKTVNRNEHKKSESEKYQERVRRERQAEAEERKRILKLVETDRQERKRAAQQAKNQSGGETSTTNQQKTTNKPRAFSNSTQCALSIRLFDGHALKHRFSSSDSLQQVREWVDMNRVDGDQPYTFFQTIPKKTFGAGEEQYTLRQLELTPSSTLILKPISNYSTAYSASASTYSPAAMFQRGTRAVGDALYTFLGLGYDPHSPYSSEESSRSSSPVPAADNPASTPNVRTINNPNDDRTTYNGNQLSLKDDHRKDA